MCLFPVWEMSINCDMRFYFFDTWNFDIQASRLVHHNNFLWWIGNKVWGVWLIQQIILKFQKVWCADFFCLKFTTATTSNNLAWNISKANVLFPILQCACKTLCNFHNLECIKKVISKKAHQCLVVAIWQSINIAI